MGFGLWATEWEPNQRAQTPKLLQQRRQTNQPEAASSPTQRRPSSCFFFLFFFFFFRQRGGVRVQGAWDHGSHLRSTHSHDCKLLVPCRGKPEPLKKRDIDGPYAPHAQPTTASRKRRPLTPANRNWIHGACRVDDKVWPSVEPSGQWFCVRR